VKIVQNCDAVSFLHHGKLIILYNQLTLGTNKNIQLVQLCSMIYDSIHLKDVIGFWCHVNFLNLATLV